MRVALAWIDPADPADLSVATGVGQELRSLGHEAVLVGPRRGHGRPAEETISGLRFIRVGSPSADDRTAGDLRDLQRRFGFDLWHCHVFGRSHRGLSLACRRGRWPLVASLHLVLEDYLPFAGSRRELGALLAGSRHVTAVSRSSLGQVLRLWPFLEARSSVVPCGVSGSPAGAETGQAQRPRTPYILCVARQAPYKGLDILLMAFARLRENRDDLSLVIAGRDQLKGALPRFSLALGLGRSVVFTGPLPHAEVRRLLQECLFFVLPSRRETFGMALLEAMAAGKASAAAAAGGVPELASHGKHALLVPPGDVEALARAMDRLASDPRLRKRLGAEALKRSRDFGWDKAAAGYAAIYERVLR